MAVTNTRGRIAALFPSNTTEAQLYVVPANTEIDGVLRICNQDTVASSFSVAHCVAGHGDTAALNTDWLFNATALAANSTAELSIHAKATETVRVKAGTASKITFHMSGNKKVTS